MEKTAKLTKEESNELKEIQTNDYDMMILLDRVARLSGIRERNKTAFFDALKVRLGVSCVIVANSKTGLITWDEDDKKEV